MKKLSVFPAILIIIACILMCSGCGNSKKPSKKIFRRRRKATVMIRMQE